MKVEGKLLSPSSCSPLIQSPLLSVVKKLQRQKEKKKKQKLFSLPLIPEKTEKQLFTILPSKMFYSKIHIPEICSYVLPVTAMGLDAELQQEPWLFSFCATQALQKSRVRDSTFSPTHMHTQNYTEKQCISQSVSLLMPLYSPQELKDDTTLFFWTSFPTLHATKKTEINPNITTRVPSTRFPSGQKEESKCMSD